MDLLFLKRDGFEFFNIFLRVFIGFRCCFFFVMCIFFIVLKGELNVVKLGGVIFGLVFVGYMEFGFRRCLELGGFEILKLSFF